MKKTPLTFHVVTLFPEAFESYLASSIVGRAVREKHVSVKFYNPRDFVKVTKKTDKPYIKVDGRPYGGGPGMVLQAEPFLKAVERALKDSGFKNQDSRIKKAGSRKLKPESSPVIYFFDASGKQFTNKDARALAHVGFRKPNMKDKKGEKAEVVLICGHYEGIDARVQKVLKAKKISIGSYTLTGGELPAMVVIDAVARQIPGVLGTFESIEEERISSSEVYTRPEVFIWHGRKHRVPKVLLSGNHAKINEWKNRELLLDSSGAVLRQKPIPRPRGRL
ncbi:MAG: tRNA (guanine37-N1)-methyltransferase [Parcubacteria group bacterium Greene0714_7]|nr:MAG: tRNA (guanine37-N1)-methyltransferase [Parcubacteria group bacterium Greene0714_7]